MWSKKRVKVIFILFFIGITGIIFVYYYKTNSNNIIDITSEQQSKEEDNSDDSLDNLPVNTGNESTPEASSSSESQIVKSNRIFIYVCGHVKNPGVYELAADKRVVDAIKAAGGLAKDAAGDYINQAESLSDGQRVYVPSNEDVKDCKISYSVSDNSTDSNLSNNSTDNSGTKSEEKININTASKEELMELPGIGESKAESIIEYRQSEGNFTSIEAVMNVTGIKEGLFNKISDYITI